MKKKHNHFLLILLILGFATAGISPACHFISGKADLIEICTAFGIKKIPFPQNGTQPTEKRNQAAANQCLFCFASQVHKYTPALHAAISPHKELINTKEILPLYINISQYSPASFHARAPPLLV